MKKSNKGACIGVVIIMILLSGLGGKFIVDYIESKEKYIVLEEKYKGKKAIEEKLIFTEKDRKDINIINKEIGDLSESKNYNKKIEIIEKYNKKIDSVENSSKKLIEKIFNEINIEYIDSYTEEELDEYNVLLNKYNEYLKLKDYVKAQGALDSLSVYVDEVNLIAVDRVNAVNGVVNEEGLTEINGVLLVNKNYPLPDWYNYGEDPDAAVAYNEMVNDASSEGIYLHKISSFRSYNSQNQIYNNYVAMYGEEYASSISAKPGQSEHQTGLSFDIGGANEGMWLMQEFEYTEEGQWLKNNAYKYGFILRFPKGKDDITKYIFEPWHYRYVGTEHSANFKDGTLTLEEYLGVE